MSLFLNKPTRTLILVMIVLVFIGIMISKFYYNSINKSNDPRVLGAREMYARYDVYTQEQDAGSLFILLDSIELIYANQEHYRQSYEVGVVYNNRTAVLLAIALDTGQIKNIPAEYEILPEDSVFALAEKTVIKSIEIYETWLEQFGAINEVEVKSLIRPSFLAGLQGYPVKEQEIFLDKRTDEIIAAQGETKRRLSVSYTNLGIIYRHREDYETAARYYQKAISLWNNNLTALNNLNILLGRPLETRNFLERLFPPEKED